MRENVTPVTKIVLGQSLYQGKRGVLFLCVCFFQFHVILSVTQLVESFAVQSNLLVSHSQSTK